MGRGLAELPPEVRRQRSSIPPETSETAAVRRRSATGVSSIPRLRLHRGEVRLWVSKRGKPGRGPWRDLLEGVIRRPRGSQSTGRHIASPDRGRLHSGGGLLARPCPLPDFPGQGAEPTSSARVPLTGANPLSPSAPPSSRRPPAPSRRPSPAPENTPARC